MNSQTFLYINIALGLFFIVYFFFVRPKPKRPTQLNLKANETFRKPIESSPEAKKLQVVDDELAHPDRKISESKKESPEKSLSVYFMFNGHEWEAHEVLGIPAGAQMPMVIATYQHLIRTSDPSTFDFYETAFKSISKKWEHWR